MRQLEQNVAALESPALNDAELAEIDTLVGSSAGADVDLWRAARQGEL